MYLSYRCQRRGLTFLLMFTDDDAYLRSVTLASEGARTAYSTTKGCYLCFSALTLTRNELLKLFASGLLVCLTKFVQVISVVFHQQQSTWATWSLMLCKENIQLQIYIFGYPLKKKTRKVRDMFERNVKCFRRYWLPRIIRALKVRIYEIV